MDTILVIALFVLILPFGFAVRTYAVALNKPLNENLTFTEHIMTAYKDAAVFILLFELLLILIAIFGL